MKFQILNWRRDRIVLLILILFYIGFGFFLYVSQYNIIYIPNAQNFDTCLEMTNAQRVNYEGTRMYFRENGPSIGVVYHGNAGSACDRDFYAEMFEKAGYSYLVVEYTGYSNDLRQPTHALLKEDVRHVVDFLSTKHFDRTVVAGESIGTGFASYHAKLSPPNKLLLISPFTDLLDIAKAKFWFYPVSLMVDNALDNVDALSAYTGSVLVVHGNTDTIVPLRLGQTLFQSLKPSEKKMVIIENAGHNDLFEHMETYDAINAFLR